MSLDGEPCGTKDRMSFKSFYDSPTCSDVKIFLGGPGNSNTFIHAHRVVLAAGSAYFKRKLQGSEYMEDRVVEFRADEEDGIVAMRSAIEYMYGFYTTGDPTLWSPTSLLQLSVVGAVAEKYGIAGLSELALETAHHTLSDCSSSEAALENYLRPGNVWTNVSSVKPRSFAFAVKILGQNLTTIRTKTHFQELLREVPQLAIDLLNRVAEEKDELEGKQKKIEDLK